MKITVPVALTLAAVVGIAVGQGFWGDNNGWDNNGWDNGWNNDDGFGRGFGAIGGVGAVGAVGGVGAIGGVSHGGYSGYGGYGGYGSYGGYGYGLGSVGSSVSYLPVPAPATGTGSGLGGLLPLLGLLFLLPFLFNTSSTNSDQIVLINSTLEG